MANQTVRYYGHYSNSARGKRKKADADNTLPCTLEPELSDIFPKEEDILNGVNRKYQDSWLSGICLQWTILALERSVY